MLSLKEQQRGLSMESSALADDLPYLTNIQTNTDGADGVMSGFV